MMNFTDQDRQCCVTLSAAKGLARWAGRCFAALSMTGPVLIVKNHHHARTQLCALPALVHRYLPGA